MNKLSNISIIIVSYNTVDYLRECLQSIYAHTQTSPEVIVVDNASTDGSCEMVRTEFPQVILVASQENLGFGLGNNLGVKHATQANLLLFNSDAYLTVDTPKIMLDYLEAHPDVACACPRVVLPNIGKAQAKTFGFTPTLWRVFSQTVGLNRLFAKSAWARGIDGDDRWAKEMQVGWVSGVCMAIRKADYERVGGFDARFFMYCEDIELCMKLAKLGKIILYDTADIVHYGGASSKQMSSKIRNAVLQQRHLLMIICDYFGSFNQLASRGLLLFGALARLICGLIFVPIKGYANNYLLRTSWARALDLLGVDMIKFGMIKKAQ